MKIALVVPGGAHRSGSFRVFSWLQSLIERFVARGDEVRVFSLYDEPRPGRWPLLGATVHNAGSRPIVLRSLRAMMAEHRGQRFDVVHAFGLRPALVAAIASRLLTVPLVVTFIESELAFHPAIARAYPPRRRERLMLSIVTKQAAALTVQSDYMRQLAAESGLEARRIVLGVDLRRWPLLPPRARDPGTPLRLLHVGGFRPVKDQATLLQAAALLRHTGLAFELELVGEGQLARQLSEMIERLGLRENVRLRAVVPHRELRSSFDQADILVMSSTHESGPLVALEAAVAGVPTVGTQVGYIHDWSPEAAIAVPVGDAAALAGGIRELAEDDQRRLRIAAAAQRWAVGECAGQMARAFAELYAELDQGNGGSKPQGGRPTIQ